MNEMTWYVLIGLVVSALTYVLWLSQRTKSKKTWLLNQLQTSGEDKQVFFDALEKLNKSPQQKHMGLFVIILLVTPVTFLVQNLWFDNQTPPETIQAIADGNQPPDLATAIQQLEQKLAQDPDDIKGQLLYAQSMVAMKRYDVATKAYEKANELQPNDAAILTEWAEAIAFRNNTGSFLGQPSELLEQAITLNPQHQKAMWLYGIVLYEKQQFAASETMWTDLLALVDSPGVQSTLLKQINQAREAQGKALMNAEQNNENNAGSPALFTVTVSAENSTDGLPDTATLFVFAKSTDGMPMPIAAQKINGPFTWPMNVSLDDNNSLQGNRLLSQFETVKLSALISYTGAIEDKQWQSESVATNNKANITLNLKRQEP